MTAGPDYSVYNHNYVEEAQVTKSGNYYGPCMWTDTKGQFIEPENERGMTTDILHAILGISTEAGELLDPIKKAMFYGKDLDLTNLDEEIGDIMWYIAIYAKARGITIEQIMDKNIRKLKRRYPAKFEEFRANNRDLAAERRELES